MTSFDPILFISHSSPPKDNAVAMITLSDDSEQEFEEFEVDYPLSAIGCTSPRIFSPSHLKTDVSSPATKHKNLMASVSCYDHDT